VSRLARASSARPTRKTGAHRECSSRGVWPAVNYTSNGILAGARPSAQWSLTEIEAGIHLLSVKPASIHRFTSRRHCRAELPFVRRPEFAAAPSARLPACCTDPRSSAGIEGTVLEVVPNTVL